MKSHREFINQKNGLDTWATKYTYETWVAQEVIKDIRTGEIYPRGSLIFCIESYLDDNNHLVVLNEKQYYKPL
jgi:hypothetical protein